AISEDGLTASSPSEYVVSSVMRGSASHVGGRWYFEVRVDDMPDGTWWAQNIGIATLDIIKGSLIDTAGMGAVLNVSGTSLDLDAEFSGEPYGAGDVIGVAADLDAGLVFFSKNGVWMNSADPVSGAGGVEVIVVPGTGSYYPAIGLSTGDQMTVNFGASAFASAPPTGYSPFGAGLEADAGGACVDPGPEGLPTAAAPMQATCSGFSSYGAPVSGGPELHVIGMYEPASGDGGPVDVHVTRQGDIALVLATFDTTSFHVTAGPGVNITQIVLSSFFSSSVTAPAGVPVDSYIYEVNGQWLDTGYAWPASPGGGETQKLVEAAEATTGRALMSFGGCYYGESFTLTD
ncbi:MAG TPA: SPRY domain-containing protein, partial [Candidatus Nanopelagicales bacterium]|nr:SPRY domain-containing protein [Candidatus Nanopelagicales bacterium]